MNGAVYISFFQGQLESVLEQVVQLAVQEISKTVGSSLNGLLLETAVKEQENRRLQLQIQARDSDLREPADHRDHRDHRDNEHRSAAKSKAGEERADSGHGRQQPPGPAHTSDRGPNADSRRLEQRGRVVEQLKSVMQRVLEFAVSELTKIVEASFDDLLLEITKMEKEHQCLEERLGLCRSSDRLVRERSSSNRGRRNSENDSMSPSGSEDNREESGDKENHRLPRSSELSSSQDWVPILDKVFGQKWCGDVWSAEQLEGGVPAETGGGGRGSAAAPPLSLEPRPSSPQQDPRWTPLEDMEVFSPDEEEEPNVTMTTANESVTTTTAASGAAPSGSAPSNKARRSSASMLHRLLTLPSQLLEEEDANDGEMENIAVSMATEAALAAAGGGDAARSLTSPTAARDEEDEEEEEEEEEERRKRKRRRVWSECEDCGRRFSRVSLLKAHRQTHLSESPPPPGDSPAPSLRCDQCGKRFSSHTRLQSHVQTNHGHKQE